LDSSFPTAQLNSSTLAAIPRIHPLAPNIKNSLTFPHTLLTTRDSSPPFFLKSTTLTQRRNELTPQKSDKQLKTRTRCRVSLLSRVFHEYNRRRRPPCIAHKVIKGTQGVFSVSCLFALYTQPCSRALSRGLGCLYLEWQQSGCCVVSWSELK
jgi:hypothetical protein